MAKALKEPSGVAAQVEALVRPAVEALGLVLWDVRFEREAGEWYLRIFIDRDAPLDTDTCEAASRAVDPLLDEADPIPQGYILEVGSPGLGRRLTRESHFARMAGRRVCARLYAPDSSGRKEVAGILLGLDGQAVRLQTGDGEEAVPIEKASLFKACDDEDLFGGKG